MNAAAYRTCGDLGPAYLCEEAADEISRLLAQISRLRLALEPFSSHIDYVDGLDDEESHSVFVRDIRLAARTLAN